MGFVVELELLERFVVVFVRMVVKFAYFHLGRSVVESLAALGFVSPSVCFWELRHRV